MKTERGLERLVFFSDAVVAIAITLLALPLVDLWPDNAPTMATPLPLIADQWARFLAFGISFAVIARLWVVHHRIFDRVLRASFLLVVINFAWLFTIVILPVWTAVVADYTASASTVALYTGTIAAGSLMLTLMSVVLYRRPDLCEPGHAQTVRGIVNGAVPTVLIVVAALLGAALPDSVNYYGLFLLFFTWPITWLLMRIPALRAAATIR